MPGGRGGWDSSLYTLVPHKVTHVLIIVSSGDFQSLPQASLRWSSGPMHGKHTRHHGPHPQHMLPWTTPPTMSPRTTCHHGPLPQHTFLLTPLQHTLPRTTPLAVSCLPYRPHTSIHVFLPRFSSLVFVQVFVLLLEFLRPLESLGSLLLGRACGWLLLCTSALPGSVSHCMNLSEAP